MQKVINIEDAPVILKISEVERLEGALTKQHLLYAITALAEDGMVVLDGAIDLAHIDAMNTRIVSDCKDLVQRPNAHFNVSQIPPLVPELMFEDVYANALAGQILEGMLGPKPEVHYLNGNTALLSEEKQLTHSDCNWWHMHWPFGMVVNVMMVEATPVNGATEVWLGTHIFANNDDHIDENTSRTHKDRLEARRKVRPPIQPSIPKGGLIIRDLRLWHGGMPNHTEIPRCMIAIVHHPAWLNNNLRLRLPEEVKAVVESWTSPVRYVADYIKFEGFDYLDLEFNYDPTPYGGMPKEQREVVKSEWETTWRPKIELNKPGNILGGQGRTIVAA